MATQFDHVYHGLSPEVGKFRLAASGMAWKGGESEQVVSIPAKDIKWAQWLRVARNFQLRVGWANDKERGRRTFDGFDRGDHDKLVTHLKNHFAITLETKEISHKGWNWGHTDFQGDDLAFVVGDRTAFELPLLNVSNSNIAGRTEVSLEFTNMVAPSKAKGHADEMVEIRFYVPGTHNKLKVAASDAGSQQSEQEDNDEEEISAAQVFHDQVKEKAGEQITGDIILACEEVQVLTPRGRYDVDVYLEFMRLRGKTYDYKVLYSSISRLFLLPKDDQHIAFILGLNTPIRQGQTRYQFLVMQFAREEEITAELNMPEEEIEKYDRLKKNYEDPTFEVISSVFRALSKKKIIGAGTFQSRDGHPNVKANLKAVQGELYLLEKFIFFVSKQPSLIELSDIHQVYFSRVGASAAARTFDLKIVTKSGPEYSFTSIIKEEYEPVEQYLREKKVKVKKETLPDAEMLLAAAGVDDDDDEDMPSEDSDGSAPRVRKSRGDDEDSEEDDDFEASSSDEGSPSESDSSDSGAATASDASGDRELAAKKKVKTKKKDDTGKKKKAKADDSDADDDNEAEKPKKKKKAKAKAENDMDVDDGKPKKKKKDDGDSMDVDEERPRPKPKPKKKDDGEEPPKKKLKT